MDTQQIEELAAAIRRWGLAPHGGCLPSPWDCMVLDAQVGGRTAIERAPQGCNTPGRGNALLDFFAEHTVLDAELFDSVWTADLEASPALADLRSRMVSIGARPWQTMLTSGLDAECPCGAMVRVWGARSLLAHGTVGVFDGSLACASAANVRACPFLRAWVARWWPSAFEDDAGTH